MIKTFGKLSKEVLADTAAKDPLTRKVYDSYMGYSTARQKKTITQSCLATPPQAPKAHRRGVALFPGPAAAS